VSDRAKALINLAREKFKVSSIADIFHFKYCINKLLTLALTSKLMSAQANFESSKAKQDSTLKTNEAVYSQIQFYTDLYVESVEQISHCVHPFYKGNQVNTTTQVIEQLQNHLENIKQIVSDCQITDKYKLIEKAENQISDVSLIIDLWWQLVDSELSPLNMALKKWFKEYLLPKTYWEAALQRTKYKPTVDKIKQELTLCKTKEKEILCPVQQSEEIIKIKELAQDLCKKFQRSSSQVEGRNGYLSMMNHTQRGFDDTRLKVLTVVHNFDIRGLDGKTPAERLFKNEIEHEPIFDYLIEHIQELPLARKRKSKTIEIQSCPTLCG